MKDEEEEYSMKFSEKVRGLIEKIDLFWKYVLIQCVSKNNQKHIWRGN